MKVFTKFGLSVFLISAVMSCKGPEGPIGPQGVKGDTGAAGATGATGPAGVNGAVGLTGAAGATGATGATGPQGPKGDKGDTGSINITSSDWFSPTTADWQKVTNTQYLYALNEPKITQNILNAGLVLVYGRIQPNSTVYLLPITTVTNVGLVTFLTSASLGKIGIQYIELSDFQANLNLLPVKQFRYVIVPGALGGRTDIDYNNYEEVKKAFNIAD